MDLTRRLLATAAARPHVLVVPVAGRAGVRVAVEAALTARGWPVVWSPADADVLVVAGEPGPRMAAVVAALWAQLPAPRARVHVADAAAVEVRLNDAAAALAEPARQRASFVPQDSAADHPIRDDDSGHAGGSGDGNAGHGDHDMGAVAGLPMAGMGEDRDGLLLDRVHVPLGPVLPDWPAGLVVHVTLQGDVVQEARAELVDGPVPEREPRPNAAVRELDALARFLSVAGWDDAADRARRLRDERLTGDPGGRWRERVRVLLRRVRRSRVLRWLIRGLPVGEADVAALLERQLAAVEAALAGGPAPPRPGLDGLAAMLTGNDLATVRLVVAALDPAFHVGARAAAEEVSRG